MTLNLGISRTVKLDFDDAVVRVKEVFKENGFGAVTEMDVKKILKEKIGADFKKYTILGMCNPKIAMEAIGVSDDIGLLLPCNVCVYENKDGETVVSAINPETLLGLVDIKEMNEKASIVKEKIIKSIDNI
ncbi:DUF302 domain-containing protein [Candidatus Acidulodesulfobacterium sp. H_13]|uniref:DUF302 domain-containing protein n=1 Tax=Candidatus Acidulodesulfobacterium sp. H_13 TaxID=3395470 RepID=UPI003AF6239B